MNKDDFRQRFRGRHRIRDQRLEDKLYKKYQPDFRIARQDERELESIFALIDDEVSTYNLGRDRERIDRERDQKRRNERIDEEQLTIQAPGGVYEMARAKAVSEYLAKVVSTDTETIRYRERVLGRTLTVDEARRFLSSPVAATVPTRISLRTKSRNVSFLDYEIGEQVEDDSGSYRMLRYSYEGCDLETRLRPLLQVPGRSGDTFMVYPGGTISPEEWWQNIPGRDTNMLLLPTPSGDSVVAMSNSALDLLAKQASRLVRRYLLEPEDATWLILTGENPKPMYMSARLSSLRRDDLSRAVLTLTVEPWVPPETLKAYHRDIRHHILRSSGGIKLRTVEVFRFVVSHMEVRGTTLAHPKLKHLAELWNKEYPEGHDWHFGDYRGFRRSYIRGHDAIAIPISE